jgi:hypothetical protein
MKLRQIPMLFCLATVLAASHYAAAESAREINETYHLKCNKECRRHGVTGLQGLYADNRFILGMLQLKEARFAGPYRGT